ncbi:MAG TPA: tetratricopeptide repeat protein, partial [Candidatus Krumholzibacteria bacterium]|nr:tetratricopeptide repeat protein [Candidatus Krumholzibacteria bacterium]
AVASYRLALTSPGSGRQVILSALLGYTRCLVALGRVDQAQADLHRMQEATRDPQLAATIARLLELISRQR